MTRLLLASLLAALCALPADSFATELRRSGFLGVQVEPLPPETRGAPALVVRGLVESGSAKQAGVRPGDVIKALDGRPMATPGEFVATARRLRAGDVASLEVLRAGNPVRVDIAVKPRPPEPSPGLGVTYGAVGVDGHLRRTLVTAPRDAGPPPDAAARHGV